MKNRDIVSNIEHHCWEIQTAINVISALIDDYILPEESTKTLDVLQGYVKGLRCSMEIINDHSSDDVSESFCNPKCDGKCEGARKSAQVILDCEDGSGTSQD